MLAAALAAFLVSGGIAVAQDPPMPPGLPPGFPPGSPPAGPGNAPAKPALPAKKDVSLKTSDGLTIAGSLWPAAQPGAPGVVLLPMYKSDRAAWEPALKAFRDRGFAVLAIDLRGHGASAKQGKTDLAPLVEKRDPKLFAAMHEDAFAAVRYLATEAKCDPKRIAIAGASVGCSVAMDTAARHPAEVAAVACLSPGSAYLGLDSVAHVKKLAPAMPLLLMVHRGEIGAGAQQLADLRPGTTLLVLDDAAPESAASDRMWAHGTKMFGRVSGAELTVASFLAARTGSKEDVVLDGVVAAADAPGADPWDKATAVGSGDGEAWAIRVGRRILFGGRTGPATGGLRFEVQTGEEMARPGMVGPPQFVAFDLKSGQVAWKWGGMPQIPGLPGSDAMFGATLPAVRVVRTESATTFEGEWTIPTFGGDSPVILLEVRFDETLSPRPTDGSIDTRLSAVPVPER